MLSPDTLLQGRYRVVRHLGQGGMGTVYEAVDQRLETVVAVKESHLNEPHLVKQFTLEARLLAKLRHTALTKVIDHFEENGAQFLVMEYIPGPDLSALLEEQKAPFPVTQVLKWADQLLNALNYLHTQTPSIIHRDIKPQNLKLTAEDQIILLDFGLAKGTAGGVSKVASVYGYTPTYAPLEQIQGTGTEPRSDLYSLAATLYQLMTNVSPPDALTRVMDITNELPDPLIAANALNPQIASGVSQTLGYAMHLNRDKRPATAAVMRELLRVAANSVTVAAQDPGKTLVLPPSVSTAETLQMPSGALPLTEAGPTVEAASPVELTQPMQPQRNTVRDPALAGFMSGGYEVQERSRLAWIVLPILGVLVIAGLAYGGYKLFASQLGSSQSPTAPVAQASPDTIPVGSQEAPSTSSPTSGTNGVQPGATPTPTPTPGATPTPKPTPSEGQTQPAATPTPVPPPPAPQVTPPPVPKTINGGVVNGKAISLPKPAYPASARAVHASGQVSVQVIIDENGSVISATAVSGHALLRSSAVSAARGARFSPTKLSGQAVKVTGTIVYNFIE